jgi:hypothetical protein
MENDRHHLGDDDVVLFLPIPRAGGASLYELLVSRFPAGSALPWADRERLTAALREAPAGGRRRLLCGPYDASVAALLGRAPRLVTMLREPVSRAMSRYEAIRATRAHPLHREARELTFREFLLHPGGGAADADFQTRRIAGTASARNGRHGPLPGPALLDVAKERLQRIAFFGLRERYEDSVRLLAHTFHWEPFETIPMRNVSGATNHRLRLGSRELEVVQERNELDLELYRFARRLFRERLEHAALPEPGARAAEPVA